MLWYLISFIVIAVVVSSFSIDKFILDDASRKLLSCNDTEQANSSRETSTENEIPRTTQEQQDSSIINDLVDEQQAQEDAESLLKRIYGDGK